MELIFLPAESSPHVYARAWRLRCFHSLISTEDCLKTFVSIQTFRRALTASVDSGAEIDRTPSGAEFGERCRKEMIGVRDYLTAVFVTQRERDRDIERQRHRERQRQRERE